MWGLAKEQSFNSVALYFWEGSTFNANGPGSGGLGTTQALTSGVVAFSALVVVMIENELNADYT